MRFVTRLLISALSILVLGLCFVPRDLHAQTGPCCAVPDNGGGTADHPPSCPSGYTGLMEIVDGLPPGTTVQMNNASLGGFFNLVQAPGGALGGMSETWQATIVMPMSGTGVLAGYNRVVNMPVLAGTSHSAPRIPFSSPQAFATDLFQLHGQLPPGDPDFDLLRITAGTGFGMPSPGHTTFTAAGGGTWAVDSFFDITYRIDFVGAPGGPFAGRSGSTTRTQRFSMCHIDPTPTRTGTWGAIKLLYR